MGAGEVALIQRDRHVGGDGVRSFLYWGRMRDEGMRLLSVYVFQERRQGHPARRRASKAKRAKVTHIEVPFILPPGSQIKVNSRPAPKELHVTELTSLSSIEA